MRIAYLIDGFNLYHSIRSLELKKGYKCKWFDISELCKAYLHLFGKDAILDDIFYFSAIPYFLVNTKRSGRIARHKLYIQCLENTGIHVVLGRFKEKDVYCNLCKRVHIAHEEKETDVSIAVKLLELCFQGSVDTIIIVSGDTDLFPAVDKAKSIFTKIDIRFAFPFDRKNKELLRLAPDSFSIGKKQYLRHQFANPYILKDGASLNKPAHW